MNVKKARYLKYPLVEGIQRNPIIANKSSSRCRANINLSFNYVLKSLNFINKKDKS